MSRLNIFPVRILFSVQGCGVLTTGRRVPRRLSPRPRSWVLQPRRFFRAIADAELSCLFCVRRAHRFLRTGLENLPQEAAFILNEIKYRDEKVACEH